MDFWKQLTCLTQVIVLTVTETKVKGKKQVYSKYQSIVVQNRRYNSGQDVSTKPIKTIIDTKGVVKTVMSQLKTQLILFCVLYYCT